MIAVMTMCKFTDHDYISDEADSSISDIGFKDNPFQYKVRITETLQRLVSVEADSEEHAELIVSENWRNSQYILGADDFLGVEFHSSGDDTEDYGEDGKERAV
jgi:hypothetical protein